MEANSNPQQQALNGSEINKAAKKNGYAPG
jgi:hypothetical protein